jgi:hypothetical protein
MITILPPASFAISSRRLSMRSTLRCGHPTLTLIPERCVRYPICCSHGDIVLNVQSPAVKPGINRIASLCPLGIPSP